MNFSGFFDEKLEEQGDRLNENQQLKFTIA
jgi:hypothetical protein